MLILRSLLLAATIAATLQAQPSGRTPPRPQSYVLRGTVYDSSTGRPVANARIWPFLRRWGAITDAAGRFELRWRGRAMTTFLVRLCNDTNLAQVPVDFFEDSIVERRILIQAGPQTPCKAPDRPPWAVDQRDTTTFQGHFIYSWEGGGWLQACAGSSYSPDWESALGPLLRRHRDREGQRTFVRFRGRITDDGLGDYFPGPLFLVSRVEEVRSPRGDDCR